jgi:iron complex outermembrane recepter protein
MGFTKSASMVRTALCAGVAATSLALPQLVHAQAADAAATAAEAPAEEITVFARRDAESLQNVPLTITAISGATLQKYNVNKVADIVSRIPTLNVQIGGSGAGAQLSLRGIGSSNISAAFDSAVALDFDGVQVSTSRLLQAGFVDPAQIDVLKGPQSLYFGKSASAGVLQIRTADPTSTWQYGATANYEFEEKGYLVNGFVSGPLSDTFGIRLAAQYNDVNEYVKIAPGTPALLRNRGLRDFVGRATFQWEPSSDFKANLKATYTRNTNDGAIGTADVSCGANGVPDPVSLLGGAVLIPSNADCNPFDKFVTTPDPSPTAVRKFPDGSAGASSYPGHPYGETDVFFTRLLMTAKLAENIKVVSTTGFLSLKAVDFDSYAYTGVGPAVSGVPGVPLSAIAPALAAVNTPGSAQGTGTQELRFVSSFEGMFNFTFGAFYEKRTIDFNTSQQAVNISLVAPDPITGNTYDWYKKHRTKTDAYSVFGSGILSFTEQLELTAGLRWTREKKVNTISVPYVHAFLSAGPAFIDSGFESGPIRFEDDNFSPEVTLRYKVSPDFNVYAAYKTGFKSGGIDNSALPSSNLLGFDNPATRDATAAGLIFQSETSKGGEIGFKSQLADRTITLNATAYYYVFKNLQVQNFNPNTIQFITANAGEVTTKGIDVDFSWRTPVDGLRFTGAAAYTNAQFTDRFITGTGPDGIGGNADDPNIDGRRAARAPRFAGNIAFDYTAPIGDSLEFGLGGNVSYSGKYFTRQERFTDYVQPAYATVDGVISLGAPGGKWKLSVIANNLTDKIIVNTSGGRPFLNATGDDEVFTVNRGRQVFVQAAVRF